MDGEGGERNECRFQINEERKMSDDDLKKELERLRSENAALKKGAATGITMKSVRKVGFLSTAWGVSR